MTDKNNKDQQKVLRAIDAAMADNPDAENAGDQAMLDIARDLSVRRPSPSPDFLAGMEKKIAGMVAGAEGFDASETGAAEVAARGDNAGLGSKWLPSWLTFPRMAAAVALLVVGLGIAGLTEALITGRPATTQETTGILKEPGTTAPSGIAGQPATLQDDSAAAARSDAGLSTGEGSSATSPGVAPNTPGGASGPLELPDTSRVIQNADYDIEVPRGGFDDRFSRMSALAAKYGGFIVSADSRKTGDEESQVGSITMRIATTGDNFARAQAEIDAMGGVKAKNVSGVDVTEEYVDLQSRLRSTEAQEVQMLELLKRAETIDDVLMVQSRLAEIQSQIEQIKGRIKYVESRTDFATIAIDLREEGVEPVADEGDSQDWGFVGAIEHAGWLAVQTVNFVIIALGVAVPALLIALLLLAAGYRIYRSSRFRRSS